MFLISPVRHALDIQNAVSRPPAKKIIASPNYRRESFDLLINKVIWEKGETCDNELRNLSTACAIVVPTVIGFQIDITLTLVIKT
jgi:hypothetical protein